MKWIYMIRFVFEQFYISKIDQKDEQKFLPCSTMQFIPISSSQQYCKMDKRTILMIIFTCLGIILSSLVIWCIIQLSQEKEDEDVLEPAKGNVWNIQLYTYTL